MFEVHVIASGSSGNCTVIQLGDEEIVVDSGLSYCKTHALMKQEGVNEEYIEGVLLTHEHSDHCGGVGPMCRKLKVPLYCTEQTFNAFNAGKLEFHPVMPMKTFEVGSFNITPLPTSHNAACPCAYFIEAAGHTAMVCTDTGYLTPPCKRALGKSDIVVIEANYDSEMLKNGPYPYMLKKLITSEEGHLDNRYTAYALKENPRPGRKVFLAHLSETNNTPDTARETVAQITGMKRMDIDCLEFRGDTRTVKGRL